MAKGKRGFIAGGLEIATGLELIGLSNRMGENKKRMAEEKAQIEKDNAARVKPTVLEYVFYEAGVDMVIDVVSRLLEVLAKQGITIDQDLLNESSELLDAMNYSLEEGRRHRNANS